ncbi:hypothetical protein ALP79_200004 [Pseudomonas savastanoi pv. fraxini]|nr:hypothetical protein ALP79_200004 [Pseudomonas savastanoi pv. fraxini]
MKLPIMPPPMTTTSASKGSLGEVSTGIRGAGIFAIPANIVVIRAALSGCDIDQVNRSAKSSALKFSAQTYGSTVLATINGRFIQRSSWPSP